MFISYFKQNLKSLHVNDKIVEFELCSFSDFKELLKPFNMQYVRTFNARYREFTLKGVCYSDWLVYYIMLKDNVKEIYEIVLNGEQRFIRSRVIIKMQANGEYSVLREVFKNNGELTKDVNVSIKKIVKGKVTVVEENTNKEDLVVDINYKNKEDNKTLDHLENEYYQGVKANVLRRKYESLLYEQR